MSNSKSKKDNVSIGATGEFYVAAELERRGFSVSLLRTNTVNYDILAISKKTGKMIAVQVKTSTRSKKNWTLKGKKYPKASDDFYYIFVSVIRNDNPEYYIATSADVEEYIKEHGSEWKTDDRRFSISRETKKNNWEMLSSL